jgi:3-oxoacyl-[acyl-carrier-protein] synthase II
MLGHTIGAAGAIELAATALALNSSRIPPTINYQHPDPECDLNYVPNVMVEAASMEAALSLTFARGGHSSVMVLAR